MSTALSTRPKLTLSSKPVDRQYPPFSDRDQAVNLDAVELPKAPEGQRTVDVSLGRVSQAEMQTSIVTERYDD